MEMFGDRKYEKSWGEIFVDFWDLTRENLNAQIRRQKRKTFKKILSFLFLILGSIYLINGLSALINELMGNSEWLGDFIIGLALVLIAIIFVKN